MFEKNICGRVNSQNGFTLIEVVVAMIIVSVSLVMVLRLFSSGLKSSRTTCDYTTAVVHASGKMEEFLLDPVSGSGDFEDGFSWNSEIEAYKEPEEGQVNLMKLKVIVSWPDGAQGQKSIELVSLKAVPEEEEL